MKIPKMYIGIAVLTILLIIVALWYRRKTQSKYTFDDIKSGNSPPESTQYANIVQCQVTYNQANLTVTDNTTILRAFNDCVRSNTFQYIEEKCPWIDTDPAQGSTEYTKYTQFVKDQNDIKTAYMDLLTRSTETTTPTLEVVEAAMQADITGASRRYLTTVCPDYFKTPNNDPTSTYSTWSVVTGATAPSATTYAFYAGATGKITAAMVNTWAGKAARYTSATREKLLNGDEPFMVGTPYVARDSTYNSNSTIAKPGGGVYLNWEISRDNGPGTNNPQA
jgi:uncharacterized Fe-S cluster protein YjdI